MFFWHIIYILSLKFSHNKLIVIDSNPIIRSQFNYVELLIGTLRSKLLYVNRGYATALLLKFWFCFYPAFTATSICQYVFTNVTCKRLPEIFSIWALKNEPLIFVVVNFQITLWNWLNVTSTAYVIESSLKKIYGSP